MWKNRLSMSLTAVLLVVLLLIFSKPFLLVMLLLLLLLVALMAVCVQRDALSLRTSVRVRSGGREGDSVPMTFTFAAKRHLFAANSILVEIDAYNEMFRETERKQLLFELRDRDNEFTIDVPMVWCGKVNFECVSVQVRDLFGLFSVKSAPFKNFCAVTYPRRMRLIAELSNATIGATRNDGMTQNHKGSDASEMFDIRNYVPGDDVRTIHWKLSSKTNDLIVRQASDPSHYNVALLPDFGRMSGNGETGRAELNTAAAAAAAIGEQLVRLGVPFCCVLPTQSGVELYEVRNEHAFNELLPRWLSFPVQEHTGAGLQYFMMEHLDQYFTRLLIFSAGRYEEDLNGLDNRIGVMVLNAVSDVQTARVESSGSCDIMEIPTKQKENEVYRVVC